MSEPDGEQPSYSPAQSDEYDPSVPIAIVQQSAEPEDAPPQPEPSAADTSEVDADKPEPEPEPEPKPESEPEHLPPPEIDGQSDIAVPTQDEPTDNKPEYVQEIARDAVADDISSDNIKDDEALQSHNDNDNHDDGSNIQEDEDDEDDYDPESFAPSLEPEPSSTHSAPPAEASTASSTAATDLLESVLAQYATSKTDPVPTSSDNPASTDLHKLLSNIGPSSGESAAPTHPSNSTDLDLDLPMTPEEKAEFDKFVSEERSIMGGGHRFPPQSRLFIGNLPTDRITKADVYRIFRRHGQIAQISIKQAYGFIQYYDSESCAKAIEHEQNRALRSAFLHLEFSKPQSSKNSIAGSTNRRRSRSPMRRSSGSSSGNMPRRRSRDRDYYEYDRRGRGRDRDGRRSPPRYGGRDMSPPRRGADCEILVLGRLDGGFVNYVENGLRNSGLRTHVEDLSRSRTPMGQVIQQIAYDGAYGVIILDYNLQSSGLVNVQVFRKGNEGSVRFDEYLKVTVQVASELINRAKMDRPSYSGGYQSSNSGDSQRIMSSGGPDNSNPMALLGTLQNMDPQSLQKVIAALQQQQSQSQLPPPQQQQPYGVQQYGNAPPPPPSVGYGQQSSSYQPQPPLANHYGGYGQQSSSGNSNYYNQQGQLPPAPAASSQSTGQPQDVKSIMNQLAMLQGKK